MDEPRQDMNVLETVTSLRPDVTPTSQVVDRHRAALRAAMVTSDLGSRLVEAAAVADEVHDGEAVVVDLVRSAERSHLSPALARRRGRRRALALATMAVAVLGGGFLVTQAGSREQGSVDVGPESSDDASGPVVAVDPAMSEEAADARCGVLPVAVVVPAGFTGPVVGPSPNAATQPAEEQFVIHWTSSTGSIEVRWPGTELLATPHDGAPETGVVVTGFTEAAAGRWQGEMLVSSPQLGSDTCSGFDVLVQAPGRTQINETLSLVGQELLSEGKPLGGPVVPRVVDSGSAETVPAAVPCPLEENPEGTVASGPGPIGDPSLTAVEALEQLLATGVFTVPPPDVEFDVGLYGRAPRGFHELSLSDGSIAYGLPLESDPDEYVIVVHVGETADGWVVLAWERSAC